MTFKAQSNPLCEKVVSHRSLGNQSQHVKILSSIFFLKSSNLIRLEGF